MKEGGAFTASSSLAKSILKRKAGLSDTTIDWLSYYKYSDDLFVKLAKAMQ